ncbi:gibberellin 2-beta-dioxygenase 8-like [Argentina anserina]|uniref:gibberellin 2-beta-dioxygenase 8-like n=1 Tax=Argentina anserina TaxID=57926 RepID=UPI0021764B38|nr:gibberellin 2-beta-dioxygenase 8-like [Potentilla anserina]
MDFEPPFQGACKNFLQNSPIINKFPEVEECELPVIDLSHLGYDDINRDKCTNKIAEAARQWGFFLVVNHGISPEVLNSIRDEQKKLFHQPFDKKIEQTYLNLSPLSYRWGNPKATCVQQFSWSEAFHISMADIPSMNEQHKRLRSTIKAYVKNVSHLAECLAEILAQRLGVESSYVKDHCPPGTNFLRLNRYAPCPFSSEVFGLLAHTDTAFLTIVQQDQVGGLQLFKDGRWIGVKPNPEALVVNIGDLFEAMSNGVYKSIRHRVITNQKVERFSVAYFYCPSLDTVIQSRSTTEPAVFKSFTLREYKQQTEKDVRELGEKVGLSRFLL